MLSIDHLCLAHPDYKLPRQEKGLADGVLYGFDLVAYGVFDLTNLHPHTTNVNLTIAIHTAEIVNVPSGLSRTRSPVL